MKLLITSTSFQDTPGLHKEEILNKGFDIDYLRGPLTKKELIPIISKYDYIICGDDEYDKDVLKIGKESKLKVLSKYGIGLDKIDLEYAQNNNIHVFNTPNVNSEAVSEHVFALLLSFEKNIIAENQITKNNQWTRLIGHELFNRKILIMGMGSVGKEVCKKAKAFGMKVYGFDIKKDEAFINKYKINFTPNFKSILSEIDYISLNMPLNNSTKHIINEQIFEICKNEIVIINTARGELVNQDDLIDHLEKGNIRGYLTDVLDYEPIKPNHPLTKFNNVIITPHIGSRNYETVERQGLKAVFNLLNFINK